MILKRHIEKIIVILIMLLFWQSEGIAEIYKYKDENGRWQFSDRPPEGSKDKKAAAYTPNNLKSNKFSDYQKILLEKYQPQSPIESATLAVVTIETGMGSGSGFFINDECYLITNKHVVRPTSTTKWKESEGKLKDEKADIKKLERNISEEKERLKIKKRKLDEYRTYIDSLRLGREKSEEEAEYQFHLTQYTRDTKELNERIKKAKDHEKEYKRRKSDFSVSSSLATVSRNFKVILKDNTKAQAYLIKLSKDEDLALLKINRCKSPFLVLDKSIRPYQGMDIFAIGSPLGLKDHVTAGIITNVTSKDINTDAQVLPGNSGGPLITKNGKVIGVNTLKVSANSSYSEGFGVAIPVKAIMQNFGSYIQNSQHNHDN